MKNIFYTIASEYRWPCRFAIAAMAVVMFLCLRKFIFNKWNRISAATLVFGSGVAAAVGLEKWLAQLNAIFGSYKTRKGHFFDDTSRYIDAVQNYLSQVDVAVYPILFYSFVVAFLAITVFTTQVLVESKSTQGFIYFGLFAIVTAATFGLAIPPGIFVALMIANSPQVKKKLVQGSEIVSDGFIGTLKLRTRLAGNGELGVHLHPKVQIPRGFESTHTLLLGASGSGKTTTMFPLVEEIYERGDRVVLYDLKRDFTAAFVGRPGVTVLSPFDDRGAAWNVAQDITTQIQAEEFAKLVCPDLPGNQKQFFNLAARDLIAGCIVKLQAEKEGRWNFGDLYALVSSSAEIRRACETYRDGALQTVKDNGGEQSAGIIGEIRNRTRLIEYLAKAWPDSEKGLSISSWVRNAQARDRMIIIQANTKYSELDKFFTTQIYSYLFKEVLSLEDDPANRRIWAIIDELPRLPALPDLIPALSLGRSKGLCIVAAMQDFGRVKELYRDEGGIESIANGFAIKLIGRLESPEAADYASRICGTNRYERTTITKVKRKGGIDVSEHSQEMDGRALTESFFRTIPKATLKVPAQFYFVSSGYPIVKLQYKVKELPKINGATSEPNWMSRRPAEENWSRKTPVESNLNFSTEDI